MGRVISDDKRANILLARKEDPEAIGPMLGELIIQGNIPVAAAAEILAVSEPTVYRWMYGHAKPTDKDKILKIKRLLTVFRKAKRAKDLPLYGSAPVRFARTMDLLDLHKPVLRSE